MKKQFIISALLATFLVPIFANAEATTTATTTVATTVSTSTPVNGSCGTSNGLSFSSIPSTGLCTTGTSTAVTGTGPWSWSCAGLNGGTTTSCSANLTAIATTSASFTSTPTCIISVASSSCTSSISWTSVNVPSIRLTDCSGGIYDTRGTGPQTDIVTIPFNSGCYQLRDASSSAILATVNGTSSCTSGSIWNGSVCVSIPGPVNGTCGTSNGIVLRSIPTTGLCTTGNASSVSGTGPWGWSCLGVNGGTTVSCASTTTPPVTGTSTATTTPIITGTSTQAINQSFVVCSQTAALKRDTGLLAARTAYNTAMTAALQARTSSETAAIALADTTAQRTALRTARAAYKAAVKQAQNTLKNSRQIVLNVYALEINQCKNSRNAALTNATNIEKRRQRDNELRKRENELRGRENELRGRENEIEHRNQISSSTSVSNSNSKSALESFREDSRKRLDNLKERFEHGGRGRH